MNVSKNNSLYYQDPKTNERFIPHVVEPSVGCDRLLYAIICSAYCEQKIVKDNSTRELLKLPYALCPYKAAILSLTSDLKKLTRQIYNDLLKNNISISIDDSSASIGKKYRRQDAIGTYYCITIDNDTNKTKSVTIRERDSMKQKRVKIVDLLKTITSF